MHNDGAALVRALTPTLKELAGELGVGYATVRAWADGTRRPGRRNRRKLAELAQRRARALSGLAYSLDGGRPGASVSVKERAAARHAALGRETWELMTALRRQVEALPGGGISPPGGGP